MIVTLSGTLRETLLEPDQSARAIVDLEQDGYQGGSLMFPVAPSDRALLPAPGSAVSIQVTI